MTAPVLRLSQGYHDDEVWYWMDKYGEEPGCKIVGEGQSQTIVKVPMHFDCAYPEIQELTVDMRGMQFREPLVQFTNPGKSYSRNVTIQNDARGGICLRERIEERQGQHPWPYRGEPDRPTIASLSLHENLTITAAMGGGIELRQDVPADEVGYWQNHFRVIGGQINDVTPSGKAMGFATDGEQGGGKWADYYEWRPMIGLYSAQISLVQTHADLWGQREDMTPVWLEDVGGGNPTRLIWGGGMEYCEQKAKSHDKWKLPDGRFRPLFGGPALGNVEITELGVNLAIAEATNRSLSCGPWFRSALNPEFFSKV